MLYYWGEQWGNDFSKIELVAFRIKGGVGDDGGHLLYNQNLDKWHSQNGVTHHM